MPPYRAALIGPGAFAPTHVKAARAAADRVTVAAAAGLDAEQVRAFCAQHDIPAAYTDTAEMLAEVKPDLVFICTPPAPHSELSVQCLDAGAWVFCEKPLCASLAEFDQIAAAEARSGRYVSTVSQWRFGSAAQHLKRLITTQEMGHPLVGVCQTLWYRGVDYYQVPWRGHWATEIGGPTLGHGIHLMDLFLWLMGDWREVRAMAGTLDRPIEVEDVSMALIQFENGMMGNITNSVLSPRQETYLRLDFQRATVEVKTLYGYTNAEWQYSAVENSPDTADVKRWQNIETDRPSSHSIQLAAMLDSMDRNERPLVSGVEARRILEFIASLYKAAFTGQPVLRGSITPDDPFYHAMHGGRSMI
ncbi:MAG: Gfo/Idh/MocA family oxidoreductase [Chloroflexi bacterium]|nr:Gfo/Idh/MocA family oxidoreductase [Chloroflexota bacterium]